MVRHLQNIFMEHDLWCDQPFEKKKSLRDKVSLWFNNRHTLGPYRDLNQSEIVKGGPPSDWPWSRYSCTCVYVWYVCCCSQTEWEVSRDARSVANLATFSAFLDPHSIFLKRLVTNPSTSWTNFSKSLRVSLWSPRRREISALSLHLLCSASVWEEPVQLKQILLLL